MASLKVAVRVRPLNQREINMESKFIIEMNGMKTTITNPRAETGFTGGAGGDMSRDARDNTKSFSYDHSYWTVDRHDQQYASQSQVFRDLGLDVIKSAYDGYNACVFAYGQTGSGKTYTMMGSPDDYGLIPRICQELFAKMSDPSMTYRAEVSYLEIYNERVRDLLTGGGGSQAQHSLRVREHPKQGPYVQDLSQQVVMNYPDIKELMDRGNLNRTTASTNMNDVSSRSHAIFTIVFTQAKFSTDSPSETHSKIHLVDLAGSERADATGATGQRLKEGSSINRSLVTLGNVISTLADLSEKGSGGSRKRFIPYRDSVLTWLLKDSLGGNSKTIMIAAISPADCNYAETLSTLRYANRAKNIINKPTVNEDPNVKLIKELRGEIARLKALLGGKSDNMTTPRVQEKLHENEARVKVLTEEWAGKWKEMAQVLQEEKQLALRKQGLGVVLDSELPHLIGIDDDILSTGIMLYHIKEGKTFIGTKDARCKQDIVLQGEEVEEDHCVIEHEHGHVTLIPLDRALCTVNGTTIQDPIQLSQGAVILLGRTNMFRFNHPAQAAKMREEFKGSNLNLTRISSLSQSMNDLARSTENLALLTSGWEMEQRHHEQLEALEDKRRQIEDLEESHRISEAHRVSEQESREKELDQKRQKLEQMHHDAQHLKKEAEEMQLAVVKEAAKLKRRSMDIEKHYQEMLAQQEQQQQQQQEIAAKMQQQKDEDDEADKQKKAIAEELKRLTEEEKQQIEKAKVIKQQLLKELEELKAEQMLQRSMIEEDEIRLKEQEQKALQKIQEAEVDIHHKRELLQEQCNKELELISKEREHLEALKKEHECFNQFTSQLDSEARERLEEEYKRIQNAHQEVAIKEKELYELFKSEHDTIINRKEKTLKKIDEECMQLRADKVYLAECKAQYEQAKENADPSNEQEQEQLLRELIAIETEQERIAEDEERLERQEKEVKEQAEKELQELQVKRDQQVETIIKDKEQLKLLEKNRKELIDREIMRKNEQFEEVVVKMNEEERNLEEMVTKNDASKSSLESDRQLLEDKIQELEEARREHERSAESALAQIDVKKDRLEKEVHSEIRRIQEKRKWLEEKGSGLETKQEDGHMKERIEELHALEDQLHRSEAELEERRLRYEHERQEELDKIDWEKFKLQEMEEMERINALVEQEVKRRLLEERVQREKQRRIEREKERQERDQELAKIKRAHEREIQRLKERYEGNNFVHTNAPTKANPYANSMTTDTGIRPPSRGRADNGGTVLPPGETLENNRTIEISIPTFVMRGSSLDTHYEFEVRIHIGADVWSVYRRYSRFRDLHSDLKTKYPQISALVFPPKKWFGNKSERVVAERRKHLEDYLRNVVEILRRNPSCPLHPGQTKIFRKQVLHEFHPFFKKGLFEVSKHGTA